MTEYIEFSGVKIPKKDISHPKGRKINTPAPRHWTRVEIQIARMSGASRKVEDWIEMNLNGLYATYFYSMPYSPGVHSRSEMTRMVIAFEIGNDALMFKLQGGHKAYEEDAGT